MKLTGTEKWECNYMDVLDKKAQLNCYCKKKSLFCTCH